MPVQAKNSWDMMTKDCKPEHGKDEGGKGLGPKEDYTNVVVAEYVWVDAIGVPRSKTKTLSKRPTCTNDLLMWNFDGSSTEQSAGENSDVYLVPRSIFKDPFRGGENVIVLSECYTASQEPAIGNSRAACAAVMDKYAHHDPWFGIEQEYTLMTPAKIGEESKTPFGFNKDGSEPAPQGVYYCGAGQDVSIEREVADTHYAKCLYSGVKVAGINAEVMPGQWEYQVRTM